MPLNLSPLNYSKHDWLQCFPGWVWKTKLWLSLGWVLKKLLHSTLLPDAAKNSSGCERWVHNGQHTAKFQLDRAAQHDEVISNHLLIDVLMFRSSHFIFLSVCLTTVEVVSILKIINQIYYTSDWNENEMIKGLVARRQSESSWGFEWVTVGSSEAAEKHNGPQLGLLLFWLGFWKIKV